MSKFCTNCGATLSDDAVFCTSCGTSQTPANQQGNAGAGAADNGEKVYDADYEVVNDDK